MYFYCQDKLDSELNDDIIVACTNMSKVNRLLNVRENIFFIYFTKIQVLNKNTGSNLVGAMNI